MESLLIILSFSALVLLLTSIVLCIIKPVARDRMLARGARSTLFLMFAILVIVPLSIDAIAQLFGVNAVNVSGRQDGYKTNNLYFTILYHFLDPGNLQEASTQSGRILAWICALTGIVLFTGLMVSTIINFMDRKTDLWRKGLLRYKHFFKNYVVIVGGNELVVSVIRTCLKNPDVDYVLILTSKDVEKLRMRIESQLTTKEERKVVLYYGDQTSVEDINALKIEKAKEVFVLGESVKDDTLGDHDAFNMNCLQHISAYAERKKLQVRLKCHVAIEHQSTFTMLKYTDMDKTLYDNIEFRPFNVYELWAKRVIVDNKTVITAGRNGEEKKEITFLPLGSREGIPVESDKRVHLIIIGMNEMGTAFAMEAAQMMHFPNFNRDKSLRTTISFIDTQAIKEAEFLKGRYANLFELSRSRVIEVGKDTFDKEWYDPMEDNTTRYHHLGANFMDVEWEFVQGSIASNEIRKYITDVAVNPNTLCTVAVCVKHPQQSLATALYLPELVLKRAEQILVYQRNMSDIVSNLSIGDDKWKRYRRLKAFGMWENCYTENALDEAAPKFLNLFYVYNREGKRLDGENPKTILAEAEEIWQGKSIAFKWSSIYNVNSFAQKLRSAGSDIDDTYENQMKVLADENICKALALTEHNRWLTERLMMGYRPQDNNVQEWQYFIKQDMLHPRSKEDKDMKSIRKEHWKAKSRAHLDICSNETLAWVDSDAPLNDIRLVKAMPEILRLARIIKGTVEKEN